MKWLVTSITSIAIVGGWAACGLLFTNELLAFTLLFIALVADLLDGYAARRWHVVSRMGVWLDSTADVALYLLFPLTFWVIHTEVDYWVVVIVASCGLFRLVRFSVRGGLGSSPNGLTYAGLPVYYIQILLALTLVMMPSKLFLSALLLIISFLMVTLLPVRKTSVRTFIVGLVVYFCIIVIRYGR